MIEVRKLLLVAGMMASTAGATASVSAKDRSVERAQQILTLSGFEPGPVDGLWGRHTASALAAIATEADLPVVPLSARELRPSFFAAMWGVYHRRTEAAEATQAPFAKNHRCGRCTAPAGACWHWRPPERDHRTGWHDPQSRRSPMF